MNSKIKNILSKFEEDHSKIQTYTKKLQLLVEEILEAKGLMVHSVSGRTKEKESLKKKVENSADDHYKDLSDITDLCGVRIITYFSDDVDKAAEAIAQEFVIDNLSSVDKRNQHDSDAFGYMSVHYIVSLSEDRIKLSEYKKFKGIKAEIQIRSVLQHAWAEIEHDLGYKTENAIPKHLRRKFSRLASLLELGDEEFINIRENLKTYQEEVGTKLKNEPEEVELDKLSLLSFIPSKIITEIDVEIAKSCNYTLNKSQKNPTLSNAAIERHLQRLQYLDFKTIAEIKDKLNKSKKEIVEFAKDWIDIIDKREIEQEGSRMFPRAISLYYLALYTVYLTGDIKSYYQYWTHIAGHDDDHSQKNSNDMMEIYKEKKSSR